MAKVVYLMQLLLALIGGRCNHFGDIKKKFSYALSGCANKIFQKLTVFVFTGN